MGKNFRKKRKWSAQIMFIAFGLCTKPGHPNRLPGPTWLPSVASLCCKCSWSLSIWWCFPGKSSFSRYRKLHCLMSHSKGSPSSFQQICSQLLQDEQMLPSHVNICCKVWNYSYSYTHYFQEAHTIGCAMLLNQLVMDGVYTWAGSLNAIPQTYKFLWPQYFVG